MPSYKTWRDLNHRDKITEESHQKFPWNKKIPKAVWRGASTFNKGLYGHLAFSGKSVNPFRFCVGGRLRKKHYLTQCRPLSEIPRSKIVQSSLRRPDLIDAGFHKLVGKHTQNTTNESTMLLKKAIPLYNMMAYKGKYLMVDRKTLSLHRLPNVYSELILTCMYARAHILLATAIIDIDGNNWSARFHTLLCTNSLVIKISPDFIEQYYDELRPNVHYIPANVANLTQVVEYVMNNDEKMKSVVKRANAWCQSSWSKRSMMTKATSALELYQSSLEKYDEGHWIEDWKNLNVFKNADDLVECIV